MGVEERGPPRPMARHDGSGPMKAGWRRVAGARTPTKQPIRCQHTPEPANRNSQRGNAAPRVQRVVRARVSARTRLKIAGVSSLRWYFV